MLYMYATVIYYVQVYKWKIKKDKIKLRCK